MSALLLRRARGQDQGDHWPGYVDALATLLLVVIFLLSIFAVAQFTLGRALTDRDAELASLRARLTELADSLALQTAKADDLENQILKLTATLTSERAAADQARRDLETAQASVVILQGEAETAAERAGAARAEADLLLAQIAALQAQIAALNEALEASEARDKEQEAQIENLSQRLNAALASKVQELNRVRSAFFERLLAALGERSDVRVVGDRFVFETDVLFDSGSADFNLDGTEQLFEIAQIIKDIARDIPDDVDWIIRVDGHTDRVPIGGGDFASNWELSAARAINVVTYFERAGVPSRRLVAAGFGEHHPIDTGRGADAYARNRRIELKLDAR